MNEVSRTAVTDTSTCPNWCEVDHEAGDIACRTERRAVARVPEANPRDVSTVHAFRVGEGGGLRVSIDGESYTVDAAREFASKILQSCDEVTPAGPAAIEALRSVIEALGWEPGPTVRDGMSVAEASRGAMTFGTLLGDLQAEAARV